MLSLSPLYFNKTLLHTQKKKQQLEPDMGQYTGSKLGKEYIKDIYCHPANLFNLYAEYIK